MIKNSYWDRVNNRIFILPAASEEFIIYAPLGNFAARIDQQVAQMMKAYLLSKGETPMPADIARDLGNLKWLDDTAQMDIESLRRKKFHPAMVTLFPTNRCNLDCLYCYANAGRSDQTLKMTLPVAKAAIRFAVRNTRKNGEELMRLGFHGGGEPMLEKKFVQECIDYARRLCDAEKLSIRLVASTNGCLSESTMAWIADTFDSLSLSCDGPEFIQNSQRPFPNGIGSWETLSRNVKKLQHKKTQFGIRVTLTDQSVAHASDIVRFFVEQWNVFDIHLEPLYQKGRGKNGSLHPPSTELFIAAYKEAFFVSKKLGARLQYSGTRLGEVHSSFCEVDGQSFSVTPDGYVTACFEVTDASKEGAEIFLYGQYNPKKDKFIFSNKKLKALQKLNLESKEFCKNCFCRWNCAGDCPAKCPQIQERGINAHVKGPGARCEINRALTQFLVEEKLNSMSKKVTTTTG